MKTTDRLEQLEARVAEMESILAVMPQALHIRAQQREESERLRVLAIAMRGNAEEIRALGSGERRRVLAVMPDLLAFLQALPDALEFSEIPSRVREHIVVSRADLEPMIEVGALAFGSTYRQPAFQITQAQLNALDSAGLGSLVEQVEGVYAMRGLALQFPEVFPRYQFDLLLAIDQRLAAWIKDGTIRTRELSRDELEARARESLQVGVPFVRRRTPLAVASESPPATYEESKSLFGHLLLKASGEELHDARRPQTTAEIQAQNNALLRAQNGCV